MTLWHMHSDVLEGFYQSDIFVVAMTQVGAIYRAMKAYDAWSEEQKKDFYFHPLFDIDEPNEEARVRQAFRDELDSKLEAVPEKAMICRKT